MQNLLRPISIRRMFCSRPKYTPTTHCIFDMDGLLIDTEPLYTEAIQQILDPFGIKYDFETKRRCMGMSAKAMGEFMVKKYNLPMSPEAYIKLQDENSIKLMQDVKLLPGVERLLCHFHAKKVPMALATGTPENMYSVKVKPHVELFKVFSHIVLASTDPAVKHGKPAPDVFLVTAERFADKPKPEQCLVFEDSPNGLESGVRAGMQVVVVPDPRLSCEDTQAATLRLESLEDFKPEEFGLPAFEK